MPAPAFPVLSFLLVAILAVFLLLVARNRQIRTLSSVTLALWLLIGTLIHAINAVVWADSADPTRAPIWCDITTKLSVGALAAVIGACLSLSRALELLVSRRKFHPETYGHGVYRLIDLGCCILFPVLYMLLHFAVQDHRFDFTPNLGCFPSMRLSSSATTTMLVPPLLVGAVALGFCLGAFIHTLLLLFPLNVLPSHLEARMGYTYPPSSFALRLICTTFITLGAVALASLTYIPDLLALLALEASSSSATDTSTLGGFGVVGDPETGAAPLLQWDWSLAHVPILSAPAEIQRKQIVVWSFLGLGTLMLLCSLVGGVGDGLVWPWHRVGLVVKKVFRKAADGIACVKRGTSRVKARVLAFKPKLTLRRHGSRGAKNSDGDRKPQRPELSRLTIPTMSPIGSLTSASKTSLSLDTPPRPRYPPGLGLYTPKGELRSGWDDMLEMEEKPSERRSGIFKFYTFPRRSSPPQRDIDLESGGNDTLPIDSRKSSPSPSPSPTPTLTRTGSTSPSSIETLCYSPEDSAFAESTRAYLASPVAHALGLMSSTMSSQSPRRTRRDTAIVGIGREGRFSVMSTPSPSPAPLTPPALQPPLPALTCESVESSLIAPPRTSSLSLPAPTTQNQTQLLSPTTSRVPPRQPIPKDTADDAGSTCSSIWDVPWPVPPPPASRSPLRSASVLRPARSRSASNASGSGSGSGPERVPLKPILKPPRSKAPPTP
ncbi:pheromone A receptor-domain-containing protein [Mycena amicta]|nr:pheromone A receptor-domain-containing protein [Mycena amicta]